MGASLGSDNNEIKRAIRLATLWKLWDAVHLRRRLEDAYNACTSLSPWETVRLGRTAQRPEWQIEGYAYMICTAEPPCLEDGEVMGWETYAEL